MSETKIVRAKIALNTKGVKEFRRISVSSFPDLCISIERFCESKFGDLKVEYLDGDGDWVRFSTEGEFEEMKRYVKDCGQVKIQVNRTEEDTAERVKPFWRRRMRQHHRRCHPGFQRGRCFKNARNFGRCDIPFIFQFHPVRSFGGFGKHPRAEGGFRFGCSGRHRGHRGGPKHWGIGCDGCGKQAWRGLRFKCSDCPAIPGYDLCGRCMNMCKELHDPGHTFERIPLVRRRCGRGKQRFVKVTKNEEKTSQDDNNEKEEIIFVEQKQEEEEQEQVEVEEETEGEEEVENVVVVVVEEEQNPVEEVEKKEEEEEEEMENNEDDQPPAEKKRFEIQLKVLGEMGFSDEERNYNLLVEEGGDMKKVVAKLLQLM